MCTTDTLVIISEYVEVCWEPVGRRKLRATVYEMKTKYLFNHADFDEEFTRTV